MLASDVILAVSSPPGAAVRGIVRASGDRAIELLAPHLPERAEPVGGRGLMIARLVVADLVLPALVLLLRGPRSATGEDTVELHLTGHPLLLNRVIDALLDSGARREIPTRRAEPGEFTARAFLCGRISLTQAEGVAATIAARSDAELRAAGQLTSGAVGAAAARFADEIAAVLALVEAGIDFTDQEDVVAIGPVELADRLADLDAALAACLAHAVGTEQLEAIPWVVLDGPANAGKSALFNALLGHERAVVSAVAGTTRDVLAEPLTIATDRGPAEVMLVDLAGADPEEDPLNERMQAVAGHARDRAELILHCVPVGAAPPGAGLLVRTKADLRPAGATGLAVSATTGTGLDALRAAITERLAGRAVSLAADAVALRPRHEAALRAARSSVAEARSLVEPQRGGLGLDAPELVAAALRAALDQMAQLVGAVSPDDVLGRIFSTFCVGK